MQLNTDNSRFWKAVGISVVFFLFIITCDYTAEIQSRTTIGRFVPVTPNTAVDTTTGQLCFTYNPMGGSHTIPLCPGAVDTSAEQTH